MRLSWDQVQTEFAGDETTNFGPRKETGTALYQVDTLATITTQNQVRPRVAFSLLTYCTETLEHVILLDFA